MNEKAIQDAYEMFKSGGYNGSIDDYKQLISTNGNALNDSYEIFKGGGYNKDIDSFKTLMGLKKKSSNWGSTLGSGSSVSQKSERKATKEIAKTKDLRNVADKGSEIFTGYPGKEKNQYEFSNGNWYELNPEVEKTIKKSKESYVPVGGLPMGGGMFINPSGEGQDFATPGTSKNSLDAIKNVPKKRVIKDDARIKALNKQFGKNAVAPIASEVPLQKVQKTEEKDYFTGAFGDVLRGFDNIVPIGIGDFVDDMARSVASGYRQGTVAQEADDLLLKGSKSTPEQIQKFINANKNSQQMLPSAEMQDYQKIYEEEGKGFWGVIKGIVKNPSVIGELMTSSLVSMATNTDALKAGAAGVATGTTYGAVTGATAGGVGAIPGSVAGAISSIPYAFGLASSVVEMGATFGELLTEELKGKELTKENVKAILEDPKKLQSIRNKAIARGVIIGAADALTGKLASGVGAKIISKSAAKSATGAVTKGAVVKSTALGAAIEAAGGSAGEATARGAIGQDMDVSEIALEGIAELPGGIRSTIQARLAKPSYKVNGAKATAVEVDELIDTMTPDDLAKTKIEIKNDYEGREFKMQDKIVTNSIKQQVKQGNPDLNEPSLNAITQLEKDLVKLEGNTTQTGKDKAAAIRTQIKNIQENQLQEEATAEAITAETPEITKKRTERITELETVLSQSENNKGTITIDDKIIPRTELENELETLKIEQNAIQEQTAGQVPVQPTTEVGKEVVQGEPTTESQVLTEEGQKVEIGGTIRGHETISGEKSIGDVREKLPNQNNGIVIVEGNDGGQYVVAFSRKGGDGKNIFEQGASNPRPGYISASVKIDENATPEQIKEAQQKAQRNLDIIIPTVVDGVINAQVINDALAQAEPQVLTEEGKAEEVVPLTLEEELQIIADEKAAGTVIEAPIEEIEKRRQEDLSTYNEEGLNEVYAVGSDQTVGEFINAKYDAELAALEAKAPVVEADATPKERVTAYRAEEQAELLKAIPKIESYKVKGKIDKTKMPKTVLAKYNKIYEKYDALISPLLPAVKTKAPVVKAPAVKVQAPKAKGDLPVMSWSNVDRYKDDVIRAMREIQNKLLTPLLDLKYNTNAKQKKQIIDIRAKIALADKILKRNFDRAKREQAKIEKEKNTKTPAKVTPAITSVKALFESNPELANEVYEALGIKDNVVTKTNKKIDFDKLDKKWSDKILNILKEKYPEVSFEFTENTIQFIDDPMVFMQLSNKMYTEFKRLLTKKRPDLVDRGLIEKSLDDISAFSDEFGTKENKTKLEKLALHWMLNGAVILPEDGPKVVEAEKIASKKKLDAFSYSNPNEIIEKFAEESKKEKVDPDTLSSFTNKKEIGDGIVIYDVDNSDLGQEQARIVLDTHFGEKSNPWCLLYKDADGSLTRAKEHWFNTYPGSKKIAFQNGKLIAFYGGDLWWDRLDNSSDGIPIVRKIKDDNLKRKQLIVVDSKDANKIIDYGNKTLGNEQNGEYKEWDKNDNLITEANFKNGEQDGKTIEYYSNGQIEMESNFKDGLANGKTILYYDDGQIQMESNFKNGEQDGKEIRYYENGQINIESTYKDKKLEGEFIRYYMNGQLKSEQNYKNGKLDGKWIMYQDAGYENGELLKSIKISESNYKDGERNGKSIEYYNNGQVKYEEDYKDGEVNGKAIEYYENGQLSSERNFKYGLRDGEAISYYKNGQLESKINFKDGLKDGKLISYYENGQIKYEANFKDGLKYGKSIDYYTNGQIFESNNSKDGKLDGKSIRYNIDGWIELVRNYKDGEFDGKFIKYNKDGQIESESNYKDGIRDGDWRNFQRNKKNEIIGQANTKAMTVLVNALKQKKDTIPHEYAHIYIAMFRDTPIVQEGIKRFGSEEKLVQAIGEQVVQQKGEAYNWWKKFTNFILKIMSDQQVVQVLTDSFLERADLTTYNYTKYSKIQAQNLFSDYIKQNPSGDIDGFREFVFEKQIKPVKEAPAPAKKSTEDFMGAIDSIKEDIKNTTEEIEKARAEAREKVNKIREEIIDLKESKGKEGTVMDLEADIKEIEDILKDDLDGLKLDLDRHVQALKEEVKKIENLDAKNPENKKTLLSYLDAAIKNLNGLNKLTYAKLDAGVALGTLKLILQGIRAGVILQET